MPAWVSRLFSRTFDQEIVRRVEGDLRLRAHFVMFIVAPEMVVLSVVLLARCACVHIKMSVGRRGCTEVRGAVGWAAIAASVWVCRV